MPGVERKHTMLFRRDHTGIYTLTKGDSSITTPFFFKATSGSQKVAWSYNFSLELHPLADSEQYIGTVESNFVAYNLSPWKLCGRDTLIFIFFDTTGPLPVYTVPLRRR